MTNPIYSPAFIYEVPDVKPEINQLDVRTGKIRLGKPRKYSEMEKLVRDSKLLPKGLAPIRETNLEDLESKADHGKSDEESEGDKEFL